MELTELEKEKINKLLTYYKNLREQELLENNLLKVLTVSVSIDLVKEFDFYIKIADLVYCNFEDGKVKSAMSFVIKFCRYTGRTLNCPEQNEYYLEKWVDE